MKTHSEWPARRFDQINRDAIDTRPPEIATACTGNCNQGRMCDCAPCEAASCCTEIGADTVVMAFCGRLCIVLLTASVALFSALLLMGAFSALLVSLA